MPADGEILKGLATVQAGYDAGADIVYIPGGEARYMIDRFGFDHEENGLRSFLDRLLLAEFRGGGGAIDLDHEGPEMTWAT